MGFFDATRAFDDVVNSGRRNKALRKRKRRDRRAGAPIIYSGMVYSEPLRGPASALANMSAEERQMLLYIASGSRIRVRQQVLPDWMHAILTLLTCGLWAPIWIMEKLK